MIAATWLDVLDETARVCAAHDRGDLIRLLRQRRAQLLDPRLRVLFVGEPGQGKSQLVNALINASVCPVGASGGLPIVVQQAAEPSATLVRARPGTAGTGAAEPAAMERIPVPVGAGGPTGPTRPITGQPNPAAGHSTPTAGSLPPPTGGGGLASALAGAVAHGAGGPAYLEVGLPRGLLATGLVLIDTPGADGPDPTGQLAELTALARPDTVLMVSDATRELSVTELNLLLHAGQSHPNLIVVLTKTDLVPDWRAVAERNRRHLAEAGIPATLIPVSAALRLRAAAGGDKVLNAESGFPELIARLRQDLTGKSDLFARAAVGLTVRAVIEQLAAPLRAELEVPQTAAAPGPIARLHRAQREVDELRRCSQRWQNTLSDEMTDLIADLEYDLRDRSRAILRRVDEAFETADPLAAWETLREWLAENLAEAATANHAWLVQRCDWIARRVADHFLPYRHDVLPEWSVRSPELATGVPAIERPPIDRFTPTQKVFTGLRGSYGGLLMFGLATTLAGMPLINPVSLGAGAVFGGKSIWDESRSLRRRRQAAVKAATQRHVDEFFLRVSKDGRDGVRQVQRTLRDHFTALTEEVQERIVHTFRTAKQAADAAAAEREQRHRMIEQRMRQLAALYEQAQDLVTGRAGMGRNRLEPAG